MKVCIDAGHGQDNDTMGRYDPGTVRRGVEEATLALTYCSALSKELIAKGHQVTLTRPSRTTSMPLGSRVSKGFGSDVFLSVHINSVESPQANGTEVLYNTDSKLAMLVVTGISEALKTRLRGATRSPGKAVLKSRIPSLLIEIAFLSNASDFKILTDEQSPIKVAQAISTALESWKR